MYVAENRKPSGCISPASWAQWYMYVTDLFSWLKPKALSYNSNVLIVHCHTLRCQTETRETHHQLSIRFRGTRSGDDRGDLYRYIYNMYCLQYSIRGCSDIGEHGYRRFICLLPVQVVSVYRMESMPALRNTSRLLPSMTSHHPLPCRTRVHVPDCPAE